MKQGSNDCQSQCIGLMLLSTNQSAMMSAPLAMHSHRAGNPDTGPSYHHVSTHAPATAYLQLDYSIVSHNVHSGIPLLRGMVEA